MDFGREKTEHANAPNKTIKSWMISELNGDERLK